jgi:predicted dehydrogenase
MDKTGILNFGIIGCGRIAIHKHIDLVAREIKQAHLSAVCDIQPDRARLWGEKYGVPHYQDYHEMLQRHPEVDVVTVLTESGNHARHVLDLAVYGKHIIVEKPMALRIEDAESMIAACAQNRRRLFVVLQNRYNPAVRKVKEAVDARRFGDIFMATVRVRWCRRQPYYDQDAWRGTWKMDGGALSNQASHHLDLLAWLAGDVQSVYARSMNAFARIEAEDTGVAVLRFRNGALGTIEATTAARPTDTEGSISIMGSKGMAEIGGFAVNQLRTWQFEEREPGDDEAIMKYMTNPPSVYGYGHAQCLRDIIGAIQSGRPSLVDGAEGMKSLALIHALYASIETGREVFLADRPASARLGV